MHIPMSKVAAAIMTFSGYTVNFWYEQQVGNKMHSCQHILVDILLYDHVTRGVKAHDTHT